jgi:hypothetical protein
MDTAEFAASFQALLDQKSPPATPEPQQPADVLLVPAPPEPQPDPFFERYFVPEVAPVPNDYTTSLPTYSPVPYQFDDHLLEENEVTGDVMASNTSNATYRAKRTGFQGGLAAVLVAVGGVLASLSVNSDIDWKLLGLAAGQAILTAVISYLHKDNSADASE